MTKRPINQSAAERRRDHSREVLAFRFSFMLANRHVPKVIGPLLLRFEDLIEDSDYGSKVTSELLDLVYAVDSLVSMTSDDEVTSAITHLLRRLLALVNAANKNP